MHIRGPDKGDGMGLTPGELIPQMDKNGIDRAVIFPFNDEDQGPTFSTSNTIVKEYVEEHPDRLIGFCRLDPNYEVAALEELDRCLEMGLKGVKLHPASQGFTPDHPYVPIIIEKAAGAGVPVILDNGKPVSRNMKIAELGGAYPDATIILGHMRGDKIIESAEAFDNIYLGTAKTTDLDLIQAAIDRVGSERIIAGSDYPYASMRYEIVDKWDEVGVKGKERRLITGGNIARILGL